MQDTVLYNNPEPIFGEMSIVYNKTSEISYLQDTGIDKTPQYVKSGTALFLVIGILITTAFIKRHLYRLYKILVNYRFANKQYEETTSITTINPAYLLIFTTLILSVYISILLQFTEYYMIIFPILIFPIIFCLQTAMLKLIGMTSKTKDISGEIDLNRKYFLSLTGIIIFPTTLLAVLYDNQIQTLFINISGILLMLTLLLMFARVFTIFANAKISYLFRFLYLCILEISPYLLLLIVIQHIG